MAVICQGELVTDKTHNVYDWTGPRLGVTIYGTLHAGVGPIPGEIALDF